MNNSDINQKQIEETEKNIDKVKIENENVLLTVNYDIKNEEDGQAFLLYQKKYVYKKNWMKTIVFCVIAVLFIISIGRNPEQPLNYILTAICVAGIFIVWYNTKKIRDSLVKALKLVEDDRYVFNLYNDKFSIETVIAQRFDESGEEIPPVEPRIVSFDDTQIDVIETKKMFVLILKRDTIYVIPKRCMSEKQAEMLKDMLSQKLNEKYEIIDI